MIVLSYDSSMFGHIRVVLVGDWIAMYMPKWCLMWIVDWMNSYEFHMFLHHCHYWKVWNKVPVDIRLFSGTEFGNGLLLWPELLL